MRSDKEMDWQDKASRQRYEMCRGCDNLAEREQLRAFENDGLHRRKIPIRVMHHYCKEYGLHLEFVDRIIGGGYSEDGRGKYCKHFRN